MQVLDPFFITWAPLKTMQEAQEWITNLALLPHPEGGFYREVYRSPASVMVEHLNQGFNRSRNISTSIYYLLRSDERSCFHRLKSDEVWYFHAGSSLTLVMLHEAGVEYVSLGLDVSKGEILQFVVPANTWFGAFVPTRESFALCSCNVAPGFDFSDFEMGSRGDLLSRFPACKTDIEMLTPI